MLLLVTDLSFYVYHMMALLKLFWPETVLLVWLCPVLRATQCISRRQCTVVTEKTTVWLSSIWPWPYRDWLHLTLTFNAATCDKAFLLHLSHDSIKKIWPETVLQFWLCPLLRATWCMLCRQSTVVPEKYLTAWLSSISCPSTVVQIKCNKINHN